MGDPNVEHAYDSEGEGYLWDRPPLVWLDNILWGGMVGFWLLGAAILLALFATGLGMIAWQLIS